MAKGAHTTGKQLSNEVARFDVKWSVRLIGYAGYMRDTCHTDLIFLKNQQFMHWPDSQYFSPTPQILITLTHIHLDTLLPIDTQYLQHIESLFQSEVAAIEET